MLSAEELEDLAETASTLVDLAKKQQYVCDDLLGQLTTMLDALDRGTKEFTRDMPNNIARQAAQEVVKGIDASVAGSAKVNARYFGIWCSLFVLRTTAMPGPLCPVAWARAQVTLCSRHVWPRPPLLRC